MINGEGQFPVNGIFTIADTELFLRYSVSVNDATTMGENVTAILSTVATEIFVLETLNTDDLV